MVPANRDEAMRIGDLATCTGVGVRMLRHYGNQGILQAERSVTGQRIFAPDSVGQVRYIRELLDAGLPIRAIREVIDCIHEPGRVEPCAVPILAEHLADYDRKIAELASTRTSLQGLIDASAQ